MTEVKIKKLKLYILLRPSYGVLASVVDIIF